MKIYFLAFSAAPLTPTSDDDTAAPTSSSCQSVKDLTSTRRITANLCPEAAPDVSTVFGLNSSGLHGHPSRGCFRRVCWSANASKLICISIEQLSSWSTRFRRSLPSSVPHPIPIRQRPRIASSECSCPEMHGQGQLPGMGVRWPMPGG